MADYQLLAPMPLITLDAGCTLTLEAIDPDTGAAVTGVTVSAVAIYGSNYAPPDKTPEPESPLPVFVPIGSGE